MEEELKTIALWADLEARIALLKQYKRQQVEQIDAEIRGYEKQLSEKKEQVAEAMRQDGCTEAVYPGRSCDYKVSFRKQPAKLNVLDESAVPDEFCEVTRKVKLRELAAHLKEQSTLPNWAVFERGEPKIELKPIKKGASC